MSDVQFPKRQNGPEKERPKKVNMVILTLINGTSKEFNFPDSTRETAFRNAWYAMSDSDRYANKKFEITTSTGEILHYKVGEIKDCRVVAPKPAKAKA